MEAKEEFLEIFYDNIDRDGAENLLEWLEKSDFFTAPASTRNHSNYEGGLCEHSIKVYKRYIKLLESEYGKNWENFITKESATVIALLHDVCKVNNYAVDYRNVKVGDKWEKKPYYKTDDALPYGHGEKSVYIISSFMKLTREEAMAINWHMGAFDMRAQNGGYILYNAFKRFPNALLFHIADLQSTYIDEEVVE